MIRKIIVGSDLNTSYSVTNDDRTITLSGLNFTPIIEQFAYIYNKTQDVLYYAPAKGVAKCTLSGSVIAIDSSFPVLVTGDELHIQLWIPSGSGGFDNDQLATLVSILNPCYSHYTDFTHIDEDNEGSQNDTKYTRHAVEMASFKRITGSYLITSDDTHNDVTLNIFATCKDDYTLPDEDTAIADSDEIFSISESVLGDAAGKTINNDSLGALFNISDPRQYHAVIFELKYEEDNTAAPANAADVRYKLY